MEARHVYKLLDEIREDVKHLRAQQHSLQNELTRYKGFVGGMAFIMGAAWAVFGLVMAFIKNGAGS
jgi:hypothetical protein